MGNLGCSVITLREMYAGMRPHEKDRTEELLTQFEQYDVTAEIARAAGALKNEWATNLVLLASRDHSGNFVR